MIDYPILKKLTDALVKLLGTIKSSLTLVVLSAVLAFSVFPQAGEFDDTNINDQCESQLLKFSVVATLYKSQEDKKDGYLIILISFPKNVSENDINHLVTQARSHLSAIYQVDLDRVLFGIGPKTTGLTKIDFFVEGKKVARINTKLNTFCLKGPDEQH